MSSGVRGGGHSILLSAAMPTLRLILYHRGNKHKHTEMFVVSLIWTVKGFENHSLVTCFWGNKIVIQDFLS